MACGGMGTMEFGRYLKEERIKSGLSMRELSRRSGISHAYISQLESGKKGTPTPEVLMDISNHLDVNYMDLMKAAGYVMIDEDFTEEEIEFLQQLDDGVPILELLKLKPTIDEKEVTLPELEIAVDVIRSLRKREEKA
jgi:HTH-type transcriptional regulator, competence development regulator